jgi:hypothetical protein
LLRVPWADANCIRLPGQPELYRQFDKRENGVIKAVLHP